MVSHGAVIGAVYATCHLEVGPVLLILILGTFRQSRFINENHACVPPCLKSMLRKLDPFNEM